MKFTNGYWLTADHCSIHTPKQVYDYAFDGSTLKLHLPVAKVSHRGNTLNGMLLTLSLSSPCEGIIRVTAAHFCGSKKENLKFELTKPHHLPQLKEDGQCLIFTSGNLCAQIPIKGEFEINYYLDGKFLTSSGRNALAYAETPSLPRMKDELSMTVGQAIYGLGERFGPFVKNGQTIETRNCDGGTASEQAYKNIPFYMTNQNHGVFVNHAEPVEFEIATEKVSRVQFSVSGEVLDYFIISGNTPKEVLTRYTRLTGRPPLVPAWSFGLWLSTSFLTDYDEKTVTKIIAEMKQRDLPVNIFHFDCFWMREYHWCDFTWDKRMFPDPEEMLKRLHAMDLKICLWINPYIAQQSPLFEAGRNGDFLLKKDNGDIWQTDQWQAGMGIVDFTNPAARDWYAGHLQRLLNMGVDCFKTDFGERIPEKNVRWHDGSSPAGMRNFYSYLYNQLVYDLLMKNDPQKAVLFARSATVGGQKFPVHWGGDCESTFDGMAQTLRGGISLGLAGFGYWSHDIGGFEGTPRAEIYKRWVPFGLLSSHSRLHGSHSYRVPWIFDEESVEVLREFTMLKLSLAPYLYALAVEAHRKGIPMLRAMFMEFPDDPTCEMLDRQYMLGPALLVAPVMSEDGSAQFYLPAGRWTEWFSGQPESGGKWLKKEYGFTRLPLYVKENTILPIAYGNFRADYDYLRGTVFKLFSPSEGKNECRLYSEGLAASGTLCVTKAGDALSMDASDSLLEWTVEIYGEYSIRQKENCNVLVEASKVVVVPEKKCCSVDLSVKHRQA